MLSAGALGAYWALKSRYDVGYFNDDVSYILQAKSLLGGRYAYLALAGEPAANAPLPGFPLLLTPFILLFGNNWDLLKGVGCFLTAGGGCLFWLLLRRILSAPAALLGTLFFLFNPTVVHFSGSVMAEPLFMALCLGVFLHLAEGGPAGESLAASAAWGVLLAWTSIVRPEGLFLAAAVGLGFFGEKLWLRGALYSLPAALLQAILILRNLRLTRNASDFLSLWGSTFPDPAVFFQAWRHNFRLIWETLTLELALGLPAGMGGKAGAFLSFLAALTAAVLAHGAYQFVRRRAWPPLANFSLGLYAFFFLTAHSVWFVVSPRYFLPLLPFVLILLGVSLERISRSGLKPLAWAALAASACSLGFQTANAFYEARSPSAQNRMPKRTFEWIRRNVAPSSRFLAFSSGPLYLYAERQSIPPLVAGDREEMRFKILQEGASHLLFVPGVRIAAFNAVSELNRRFWTQAPGWAARAPRDFRLLYSDQEEGTSVYEAIADPVFLRAFRLYESSLGDLEAARFPPARQKLKQALALYPDSCHALNAYGLTFLLPGDSPGEAAEFFRRSAQLCPEYRPAWRNLQLAELSAKNRRKAANQGGS